MATVGFRPYRGADREICLGLFEENCPEFFAPNERADYERFLAGVGGQYQLCSADGRVVGAYGLCLDGKRLALRWMLLSPRHQRRGFGSAIMARVLADVRRAGVTLRISASHKSSPFFARFGAIERSTIPDGWGPGMHRVEMELSPTR
jgi:GNAT superfamily N-acetyltransferase